jgi:hypothetical protein
VREHEAKAERAELSKPRTEPLAATPAEWIAGWQRSLGNRAVARLLARQEGSETGPTVPRRRDREDPLIETVRGPILTDHGRYRWLVRFRLGLPAESNGWLIQELYQEGQSGAFQHFWECWRVLGGRHYPEDPSREEGVEYDDRYVHGRGGAAPDPAAWHRHVGVVRFYPGPLPPEFGPDRGANFYNNDDNPVPPSGWTGQGTRHDAYAEWDYTADRRRNGFVAYADTEELRAGDPVTFRPRGGGGGPRRLEAAPETVPQRL